MNVRPLIVFFIFILGGFTPALADSAGLTGLVRDSSGAVIAGAEVKVTNRATNFTRTVTTNGGGRYVVPELPPGEYEVEIRKDGFKTVAEPSVVVNVAGSTTYNATLSPGSVDERVTVEAERPLVTTDSGGVGTVVDRQFVENLPLNGRSFQALIELTPGAVTTRSTITSTGQFSVNGQRTNANYFMVDGVSANFGASVTAQSFQQGAGTQPGLSILGGTNALVPVEGLQEFRVQTSSYAAEYGRSPGAQISITTRSGTNRFTGSAFNYFRNEALDANDWFNNRDGRPRLPLRQNDFGGTFGGPVRIPGLYDGRDRTFFFATYEGLRLRVPGTIFTARVPSVAARAAATGPFRDVLNAFPLPNAPAVAGDPADTERYITALSDPSTVDSFGFRLDQRVGDKLNLFGRFSNAPSRQSFRSFPSQENRFARDNRTLTVGATWTARPTLVFDARFNYSRSRGNFDFVGVAADGAVLPPDSLIFPSFAPRESTAVSLLVIPFGPAGISASNLTQGRTLGQLQQQYNWVGTTTLVIGNHEIRFGGDYRLLLPTQDTRSLSISYAFGTPASRQTGVPTQIQIQAFAPVSRFRIHNTSLFAQDTWRATPRLTLTYGLRYELNPPLAGDRLPFSIDGLENPLTATISPAGNRQWETTYTNFAPRVGVAYQLPKLGTVPDIFEGMVVRGGFGVFYDVGNGTALRGFNSFPFNVFRTITNPAQLQFPAPDALLQPPPFLDASNPPFSSSFFVFERNFQLPYTLQWNVSVEKALTKTDVVTVSYVGAAARRLLRLEQLRNFNQAFAQQRFGLPDAITVINPAIFGPAPSTSPLAGSDVNITRNGASSDYHALQAQYQRRLTRGLQILASYTWSKSIDDVSDETITGLPPGAVNLAVERGPSDFDIRHNFATAFSWNLPGPKENRWLRGILGGWGLDGIYRARSGAPFNIITQVFDPLNIGSTRRANVIAGIPQFLDDPSAPGGRRVNPAAFAVPAAGQQGSLGRNSLRWLAAQQFDLSARRTFNLTESVRLQFRADIFNLFNNPNFTDPGGAIDFANTPTFGRSLSMLNRGLSGVSGTATRQTSPANGFNQLFQFGGPRSVQLSLKLLF